MRPDHEESEPPNGRDRAPAAPRRLTRASRDDESPAGRGTAEAEHRFLHGLASTLGAASNLAEVLRAEECAGAPVDPDRTRRLHEALRDSLERAMHLLCHRRNALRDAEPVPLPPPPLQGSTSPPKAR